jgi:aminoglycoside/choline kinase family phosphotransferase
MTSTKKNITLESEIIKIEKLVGDASTRRYFRIKTSSKSYIVCLSNPENNREQNENFIRVQNCLHKNGITVPMLYDIVLEKGYFLQEDLGDETLLKKLGQVESTEQEFSLLEEAIGEMIKIQSVDEEESSKTSLGLSFDLDKLMYEVNLTTDNFLNGYLNSGLSDLEKGIVESTFIKICTILSSELMVLTHRDFHTRNIMVNKSKQAIIDFQDARMGIPQYDLVSMLEDNYYKFHEDNKNKIKETYWNEFIKKLSLQESKERYEQCYDLMAIQRIYKALGTFGSIYLNRNDNRYLKYIGFSFERLRALLLKYPEYRELKNILTEHYYEQ